MHWMKFIKVVLDESYIDKYDICAFCNEFSIIKRYEILRKNSKYDWIYLSKFYVCKKCRKEWDLDTGDY